MDREQHLREVLSKGHPETCYFVAHFMQGERAVVTIERANETLPLVVVFNVLYETQDLTDDEFEQTVVALDYYLEALEELAFAQDGKYHEIYGDAMMELRFEHPDQAKLLDWIQ